MKYWSSLMFFDGTLSRGTPKHRQLHSWSKECQSIRPFNLIFKLKSSGVVLGSGGGSGMVVVRWRQFSFEEISEGRQSWVGGRVSRQGTGDLWERTHFSRLCLSLHIVVPSMWDGFLKKPLPTLLWVEKKRGPRVFLGEKNRVEDF